MVLTLITRFIWNAFHCHSVSSKLLTFHFPFHLLVSAALELHWVCASQGTWWLSCSLSSTLLPQEVPCPDSFHISCWAWDIYFLGKTLIFTPAFLLPGDSALSADAQTEAIAVSKWNVLPGAPRAPIPRPVLFKSLPSTFQWSTLKIALLLAEFPLSVPMLLKEGSPGSPNLLLFFSHRRVPPLPHVSPALFAGSLSSLL
jgi:hypothetical protein